MIRVRKKAGRTTAQPARGISKQPLYAYGYSRTEAASATVTLGTAVDLTLPHSMPKYPFWYVIFTREKAAPFQGTRADIRTACYYHRY